MAPETFRVVNTPQLAREVAKQCALHSYSRLFLAFWVAMAALFLLFLAAGGRDWEIGVMGTGLLIIVMSPVLNYVMAVRRIAKHFKRRSSVSGIADADYADYGFSEDGVSATSMLGMALVPWTRITRLRRFHRIWLMYMGSHCLGVFPTHLLPTEVKDLLVAQIRAHGGRLA